MKSVIKIGCGAGAWGDSSLATGQLLRVADLDYIVYEALAEVTMAILTRAKMKNPNAGYAIDFIDPILKTHLREIRERGIRVITNAGGINPNAAADALRHIAQEQGIDFKVAVVAGDDLMPQIENLRQLDQLREVDIREMAKDTPLPEKVLAINAYLGAFPIAKALDDGADVVITGRVVDSALVLAPCIHEFGWQADEYDKLAQGSLAGHLLECGPQATGGLLTDWELVESWVDIGYPIAEVSADSSFILTKPDGTDGLVNRASVTEQILYEIGDPRAYILPDVVCDFADVQLIEVGENRVLASGAKGAPPPPTYKACALEMDGYRLTFTLLLTGRDAVRKAQRVGETLFARMRRVFPQRGWDDFRATSIEVMGAESQFASHSWTTNSREVILKVAAHHDSRQALTFFAREIPSSALSMAQSIIGFGSGLPRPMPLIRVHSMLIPRNLVTITVNNQPFAEPYTVYRIPYTETPQSLVSSLQSLPLLTTVPLLTIAYGRSGDKGNICNVGIVARKPEFVAILRQELTAKKVKGYLGHLVAGKVERFELPGLDAFNFVLYDALGGGGTASLRYDPLGKGMAQILLECPIAVPRSLLLEEGASNDYFSVAVCEGLGTYVYCLIDPADETIFYVGKGQGNRLFEHLKSARNSVASTEKLDKIREIEAKGQQVKHVIHRHGLSEKEALEVEASLIDHLNLTQLTNQMSGHQSRYRGQMSATEVIAMYDAPPLEITEPVLLITVNRLYQHGLTPDELYEITCGNWVLGDRRHKAKYACAVYNGIVRQVYKIESWSRAKARDRKQKTKKRWRFTGTIADGLQHYIGKSVEHYSKPGAQNPIRYVNC